jgi:hypothetical protein
LRLDDLAVLINSSHGCVQPSQKWLSPLATMVAQRLTL